MDRRAFLEALAIAPVAAGAMATDTFLPPARDLLSDGERARHESIPIVVLFSLPGCPYCEIVRRSHLAPRVRDPEVMHRLIVREVVVSGEARLTDFDGRQATHAAIAKRHGYRTAPVVAFWDGAGRTIADPLVGMLLPDYYDAYLQSSLEAAWKRLGNRR